MHPKSKQSCCEDNREYMEYVKDEDNFLFLICKSCGCTWWEVDNIMEGVV